MDLGQLVDLLKRNAELAVTFDSEGNKEAAGKTIEIRFSNSELTSAYFQFTITMKLWPRSN